MDNEPDQNGHYVGQKVWVHQMSKGFPATICEFSEDGWSINVECNETPDYGRSGWYHPELVQDLEKYYSRRVDELETELKTLKTLISRPFPD